MDEGNNAKGLQGNQMEDYSKKKTRLHSKGPARRKQQLDHSLLIMSLADSAMMKQTLQMKTWQR